MGAAPPVAPGGVATAAAVPTIWVRLSRLLRETGQTLGLRYITNSGGAIPPATLDEMPSLFPGTDIFLMYGLTEAFRSSYLEPAEFDRKRGSIGKAIPNVELFVVDPESGLCQAGEVGELVHRGSLVSMGYWGQPELSARIIRANPHLAELIGDEPVLHSGDLVKRDEEGFLWFVGRRDNLIKSSGFRVSPEEVEENLCSLEGVAEAVAFGVPDDELGQRIHVAVDVRDGFDMTDQQMFLELRRQCPPHMVPSVIHRYPDGLPRTPNGKLDRTAIRKAHGAA